MTLISSKKQKSVQFVIHCFANIVEEPLFAHLHICFALFWKTWIASELIKCDSRVVHKLFNKTMQKLSAKLSMGGMASLKKGVPEATTSFASPNIHPWLGLCFLRRLTSGIKSTPDVNEK